MPYDVTTAVYEGPFDLLLHLILREQVDIYEISLLGMEANLATNLANSKTFVIEVIPPQGAVLFIERTTPVVVAKYNDLT